MATRLLALERISDPYHHCYIIFDIVISCEGSPSSSCYSLGVTQFKSEISPEQHEFDIKSQTSTCPHCKVIKERVKSELATWSALIIPESPDVTNINKGGSFKYPEKLEPVLDIAYQLYVCCLVNKRIFGKDIRTRTECSYHPCPYIIGASSEILLFIRHCLPRVTVRPSHAGKKPVYNVTGFIYFKMVTGIYLPLH